LAARRSQENAVDHAVYLIQVSPWKKLLLEGASDLFSRGKKSHFIEQLCNGLGGKPAPMVIH